MTLASSIITAAYRESNIIARVATPNASEVTEALNRLNPIVLAAIGFDAGQELKDLNVGGQFDNSIMLSNWVPEDVRLVLNLSSARSVSLHPQPYEGQRFAIVDAGKTLDTAALTVSGNGRLIETATTITLNTESLARQWMYRADTANWVRLTDLASSDQMPFPEEFDDYFIISLALRLNPRHGRQIAQETSVWMDRMKAQLAARYRRPRDIQDSGTLGLLGQQAGNSAFSQNLLR